VRCGDTFAEVQIADLQALVERYAAVATEATRLAQALDAELVRAIGELRQPRILRAASGAEPHWLTKDFNVLYAVTRELLLAVGRGDTGETARALNAVAAQLTRLKPAFTDTEEVKRLVRERRG
jgi:hypothetical protein